MGKRLDIQMFPLLKGVAVLILGLLGGEYLPDERVWMVALVLSLLAALVSGRWRLPQNVAVAAALFAWGACLMVFAEKDVNRALPAKAVDYEGVLMSEPAVHGKVVRFDLMVLDGSHPLKVKASLLRDTVERRYERLHVGDGIRAVSLLEPPRNFLASPSFDYARWLRLHDYVAQTFIYYTDWTKAEVSLQSLSRMDHMRLYAQKMRVRLVGMLRGQLADEDALSVVAAMALGEKSMLSRERREEYAVSGVSHVLALSGLHLGTLYSLLTLLFLRRRRQWLVQLLAVSMVWCYALMVGLSPSVVRSSMMLTLYAFVSLIGRNAFSINALSFAAFVMLVANPLNLYDIGFQLSFASVLAILLLVPLMKRMLPWGILGRNRVVKWLVGMLMVSLAAQVGTAPLVAYYFGRFSCYFFLSNILAVPLTAAILWLAVLFFLSAPWTFVHELTADVLERATGFLNRYVSWVASLPGASIEGLSPSSGRVLAIYLLIGCFCWFLFWLGEKVAFRRFEDS